MLKHGARAKDEEHVKGIMASFESRGIQKKILDVRLVMLYPAGDPVPDQRVMSGEWDFDADKPPIPLAAFVGAHSTTAVQRLRGQYGDRKEEYNRIHVKEIIICEDTVWNNANLRFIGTMDNTVKEQRLKMNMIGAVLQLRESYEYGRLNMPTTDERDKYWKVVIADAKLSMPFNGGSFNTIAAMALKETVIWAILEKIFKGHVVHNKNIKQQIPKALTHFDNMGNIPTDKLVCWLSRIVEGTWDTKTFKDRCGSYKKENRVLNQIVDYVSTIDGNNYDSFDQLRQAYPSLANADLIRSIVHACGDKAKDEIPKFCVDLIDQAVAKDMDRPQRPAFAVAAD
jgi:hypothetical protein